MRHVYGVVTFSLVLIFGLLPTATNAKSTVIAGAWVTARDCSAGAVDFHGQHWMRMQTFDSADAANSIWVEGGIHKCDEISPSAIGCQNSVSPPLDGNSKALCNTHEPGVHCLRKPSRKAKARGGLNGPNAAFDEYTSPCTEFECDDSGDGDDGPIIVY